MQKFCNQCGRLLKEGEVCTCRQGMPGSYVNAPGQTNSGGSTAVPGQGTSGGYMNMPERQEGENLYVGQQRNGASYQTSSVNYQAQFNQARPQFVDRTTNVFSKIVPILKHPVEGASQIASMGDSILGIEMIIFNLGVIAILLVLAMIEMRFRLGQYAAWVNIPYVKIVISAVAVDAAVYFSMAGLLLMTSKMIFRADTSFAEIISVIGTKALLDALITVVSMLLLIGSSKVALVSLTIGMIYSTLVFLFSYADSVELEGSKKVYSVLITYACLILLSYFLSKLFLNDMLSSLKGLGM